MTPARDDAKLLLSAEAAQQLSRDFPDEALLSGVEVFRAVRFLAQRMNEATSAWVGPYNVSATKFNYLAVLYARRKSGLTAGELGNSVRTSSGTVTTMLDALERERLVARYEHPSDGRSVVIKLTPKGERLYIECCRTQHAGIMAFIEALGPDRARKLLKVLVEAGNALRGAVEETAQERVGA